jgi:hypothetical protein
VPGIGCSNHPNGIDEFLEVAAARFFENCVIFNRPPLRKRIQ